MAELFRYRLNEAIREVERELDQRRRLYHEWVQARRMSRLTANSQMGRLEAAHRFLLEYREIREGDYEGETTDDGALAR